jgi:uncharacterized protein (DUF2147 family)
MSKHILILTIFLCAFSLQAQTIFGKWHSFDEETKAVESVIEIYQKKGKAYAKIIKITDQNNQNAICTECKGKRKNNPILGMDILTGLKKDGEEWSGGKILDPKNGKEYKCYIRLLDKNTLKIRGYIGLSMFGRTVLWKRAN